jgi:hypothetical protein
MTITNKHGNRPAAAYPHPVPCVLVAEPASAAPLPCPQIRCKAVQVRWRAAELRRKVSWGLKSDRNLKQTRCIIVGKTDLVGPSLPVSRDRFPMIFSDFSFNRFVISYPDKTSALIDMKGKRDQAKN